MRDTASGTPGTIIRDALPADVETLFEIRTSVRENHQSREELATIGVTPESVAEMLSSDSHAWVAEVDGAPAAFSMARAAERTVFAMFVRPEFEGRGLGRALMERAEDWLFRTGAEEIWLTTGSDPSIRANGFYRRLGWLQAGTTEDGQLRYIKRRPGRPDHGSA
jgi:GNAT superfamily N-acetyltransferase